MNEERRVKFFWHIETVGFYGHDDNGVSWSTVSIGKPSDRVTSISSYERCAICETLIRGGYRSAEGELVCPAHVDLIPITGYELEAWHLQSGERVQREYDRYRVARSDYDKQVAQLQEAQSPVTLILRARHKDGAVSVLGIYGRGVNEW